jgi:hypothetical protein
MTQQVDVSDMQNVMQRMAMMMDDYDLVDVDYEAKQLRNDIDILLEELTVKEQKLQVIG